MGRGEFFTLSQVVLLILISIRVKKYKAGNCDSATLKNKSFDSILAPWMFLKKERRKEKGDKCKLIEMLIMTSITKYF